MQVHFRYLHLTRAFVSCIQKVLRRRQTEALYTITIASLSSSTMRRSASSASRTGAFASVVWKRICAIT